MAFTTALDRRAILGLLTPGGEAARNTDPTEAKVFLGTSYKIANVDKTGSFPESTRNTDPGVANVADGTAYKILNVDKVGTMTAYPVPTAPVLTVEVLGSTSALLTWTPGILATSFQPKYKLHSSGTWIDFGAPLSAATKKITGLTAASDYDFKVTATNNTGSTDSNIESKTTGATTDLLTAMEARIKVDIEATDTGNGYNYTWGTCNEPDISKKDVFPNADIYLPQEDNQDEKAGSSDQAYTNETAVDLYVNGKLDAMADNPGFSLNTVLNKAVDDLKRCFANDPDLNGLCWDFQYRGWRREQTNNGDVVIPGRLIVRFAIVWAQDQLTPSLQAN